MKSAWAVVFLLLISTYYINNTMFWHSHIVNGVSVTHSHMHQPQHHKSLDGGHTTGQLILINMLQELMLFTGATLAVGLLIPIYLIRKPNQQLVQATCLGYTHFSSLRAPPACK